jgi:hypothetical protein
VELLSSANGKFFAAIGRLEQYIALVLIHSKIKYKFSVHSDLALGFKLKFIAVASIPANHHAADSTSEMMIDEIVVN